MCALVQYASCSLSLEHLENLFLPLFLELFARMTSPVLSNLILLSSKAQVEVHQLSETYSTCPGSLGNLVL